MILSLLIFMVSWWAIFNHDTADAGSTQVIYCEDRCIYNERAKDAECTNRLLDVIPTPRGSCANAHTLEISSNSVSGLSPRSFTGFRQLKYLYLQRNRISAIGTGTFIPIKGSLILLNVSDNFIERIGDGTFVNMTKLRAIFIRHNHINEISSNAFTGMLMLSKLDLQDNRLLVLNTDVFQAMPKLLEVNLRSNFISAVTGEGFSDQRALSSIDISQNDITSFDCAVLNDLKGLDNLNISNNPLRTIRSCREEYIPALRLDHTQLNCDCRLRDLAAWLQKNPDSPSPNCSTPELAKGEQVRDFIDIDCVDDMIATTQNVSTRPNLNLPNLHQEMWVTVHGAFPSKTIQKTWNDTSSEERMESGYQPDTLGMKDPLQVVSIGIISLSFMASILLVCVIKHYWRKSSEGTTNQSTTIHVHSDNNETPQTTGNVTGGKLRRIRHDYAPTVNVHRSTEANPCNCRQRCPDAMTLPGVKESGLYFVTDLYNSTRHNQRTHTCGFNDCPQRHSEDNNPGYDHNTEVINVPRCHHSSAPRNPQLCGKPRFKRRHKQCTHTYGDTSQHNNNSYPGNDEDPSPETSRCHHLHETRNHQFCKRPPFKRHNQCTRTYGCKNKRPPRHNMRSNPDYDGKPDVAVAGMSRCHHSQAPRNQPFFGKAHFRMEGQILRITFEHPPVCNSTLHIPCSSMAPTSSLPRSTLNEIDTKTAIYIPHD